MEYQYLLFAVLLAAAATDILWRRIPNIWLWSWFLTGLLLAGSGGIPWDGIFEAEFSGMGLLGADFLGAELSGGGVWESRVFGIGFMAAVVYLGRAAVVYLLLVPGWRLRMVGAGDVKLCSVMAAYMGIRAFALCAFYSLFVGSAVSFFYMLCAGVLRRRLGVFLAWFRQCISCNRWIPYRRDRDMEGTIPFSPMLLVGYLVWWLW